MTAVLTAETSGGLQRAPGAATVAEPAAAAAVAPVAEHARVQEARAKGATGDGAGPRQAAAAAARRAQKQVQSDSAASNTSSRLRPAKAASANRRSTVNLALGLQAIGLKVGMVDADIYGPSQPRLLGVSGKPAEWRNGKVIKPMTAGASRSCRWAFSIEEDTPVVWRGPMVVSALGQMLRETDWAGSTGDLDVLVVDMPPGTGDIQLTISQNVPLSGAVIVSTPQDLALIDARKGIAMFKKRRSADPRHRRKHELLPVPELRHAVGYFRPRRRARRSVEARRAVPRRSAAAHGYPRDVRQRQASDGDRARKRPRRYFPRAGSQSVDAKSNAPRAR